MMTLRYHLISIFLTLILIGCSASELVYYEIPVELKDPRKKDDFLNTYSKFIRNKKIFLDPGHGGSDRRSKGYNDLVTEADVNLNVALSLRNFLHEAGAVVYMSRDKDITVDLTARSLLANDSGAEIFISIHHNAPGTEGDTWTNYTSTYYHSKENNYNYEPSERDMARFIQRDLVYAMRNSGGLGSFDGTYSDYNIYPGEGFSVLRLTEIPAVLVECAFFTNPFEERRLSLDEFNKIEAWGIFRGLCRYFSAGIPEIKFYNENAVYVEGDISLLFSVTDTVSINSTSLTVQFDSINVSSWKYDILTGILEVNLLEVKEGEHPVRIIAENKNGNHSFPFHKKISVIRNK